MITMNGKTYQGNNIVIQNDKVFIDGKEQGTDEKAKVINVIVTANIESLEVDYCDKLEVMIDDELWPLVKYREMLLIR